MTAEEKAALEERLDACKRYMKVDYDEDDELIAGADAGERRLSFEWRACGGTCAPPSMTSSCTR